MRRTVSWVGPWLLITAAGALGLLIGSCAFLQKVKTAAIDCSKPVIQAALTDAEDRVFNDLGGADFKAKVQTDVEEMGVDLAACVLKDIATVPLTAAASTKVEASRASAIIADHGWKFEPAP